jgi:hypothetical protein
MGGTAASWPSAPRAQQPGRIHCLRTICPAPRDAATKLDAKRQEISAKAVSGCRRVAALVDTDTIALNELRSVQDSARLSNVETTAREPEEELRRMSIKAG